MVRSNRGVGSVRPRSSKLDVLLPNQHVYCLQKTVGLYIILLSSVFFPHFIQQNKLYNIIYICTVHYRCFGLETSLSYSMVLFSITSHPPAITLGASLDWFGQETQEECSLEAMTEAYEGETTKKTIAWIRNKNHIEICCIYTTCGHQFTNTFIFFLKLVGLARKGTINRPNTVVMLAKGDIVS